MLGAQDELHRVSRFVYQQRRLQMLGAYDAIVDESSRRRTLDFVAKVGKTFALSECHIY